MSNIIQAFPKGSGGEEFDFENYTPIFIEASTRANIASGEKNSVILGKLKKWYTDLKAVAFSGNASDITSDSTHRFVTDTEKNTWNGKQNALTAGANITINNNQISASGVGGYSKHFTVTPQTKIQINCTNVYQTIYVSLFYGDRALKRITLYEYGSTLYEDTIAQTASISLEATRISAGKFRITIPTNSQVDLFSCESFTYQTIS